MQTKLPKKAKKKNTEPKMFTFFFPPSLPAPEENRTRIHGTWCCAPNPVPSDRKPRLSHAIGRGGLPQCNGLQVASATRPREVDGTRRRQRLKRADPTTARTPEGRGENPPQAEKPPHFQCTFSGRAD